MEQLGRRALTTLSLLVLLLGLGPQPVWGNTPAAQAPRFAPGRLLVKFKPGVSPMVMAQTAPGLSVQDTSSRELTELGASRLQVPDDQLTATLAALRQNPQVEYAEPDYPVQVADVIPNDPYWSSQWGPPDIQAPQAWSVTTGTSSVTIAIIDTGVDLTHPDLASQIDSVNSTSFLAYTSSPQDDFGHGTHVAGIAAAIGSNGIGIAGIAWGVRIMALKVLDNTGSGYESDVASAITYAADHGAQVINLSLGGSAADTTLANAVSYAHGKGVTIVAAAGNNGSSAPFYPAAYPHVIAVASVNSSNQASTFSNYGSDIALAAPGEAIYSTMWAANTALCPGSDYCALSGTSMATPHVAGVAALLAGFPQFNTPDRIQVALENTALDLGTPGWDAHYGYGLVQASAALHYGVLQVSPAAAVHFAAPGSTATYNLAVINATATTGSFNVTLSSGAPFSSNVTPTLIGNLAPKASAPVTVTVTIPPAAVPGEENSTQVTVTSATDASTQAIATLLTAVPFNSFLPLALR